MSDNKALLQLGHSLNGKPTLWTMSTEIENFLSASWRETAQEPSYIWFDAIVKELAQKEAPLYYVTLHLHSAWECFCRSHMLCCSILGHELVMLQSTMLQKYKRCGIFLKWNSYL